MKRQYSSLPVSPAYFLITLLVSSLLAFPNAAFAKSAAVQASRIEAIEGGNQTAVIGNTFAKQLRAQVKDASGKPVAKVVVKFATSRGKGSAKFIPGSN